MLSSIIGGLGLSLTGADTVIFVEHDWNPMKDLQAMDRAHRIGQKKVSSSYFYKAPALYNWYFLQVVNVYRLITRNTVEEKILGLQKFKLKTANSVITKDNASLNSMATGGDQLFDLFSLDEQEEKQADDPKSEEAGTKVGVKALLESLPELWDDSQYSSEYNMDSYSSSNHQ